MRAGCALLISLRKWSVAANAAQAQLTALTLCANECGAACHAATATAMCPLTQRWMLAPWRLTASAMPVEQLAYCAPRKRIISLAASHPWQDSTVSLAACGRKFLIPSIMIDCITIRSAIADGTLRSPLHLHKAIAIIELNVNLMTTGAQALGVAATPRRYRPSAPQPTREEGAWLASRA